MIGLKQIILLIPLTFISSCSVSNKIENQFINVKCITRSEKINTFDGFYKSMNGRASLFFTKEEQEKILVKAKDIDFFNIPDTEENFKEELAFAPFDEYVLLEIRFVSKQRTLEHSFNKIFKEEINNKKFLELVELIRKIAFSKDNIKMLELSKGVRY